MVLAPMHFFLMLRCCCLIDLDGCLECQVGRFLMVYSAALPDGGLPLPTRCPHTPAGSVKQRLGSALPCILPLWSAAQRGDQEAGPCIFPVFLLLWGPFVALGLPTVACSP